MESTSTPRLSQTADIASLKQKDTKYNLVQSWPQSAGEGFNPQHFYHRGDPDFRCGIVIRIIPYAHFSPPLSLPLVYFSKNMNS